MMPFRLMRFASPECTLAQQMEQDSHHLVWEIDNAVDEALSGFGDVLSLLP